MCVLLTTGTKIMDLRVLRTESELRSFIRNNCVSSTDWDHISQYQELSEYFLSDYGFYLNWDLIAEHQKLSASDIKEFSKYLDKKLVQKYQKAK